MLEFIKKPFSKENYLYSIFFILGVTCILVNRCLVGFGSILFVADIGSICGILSIIFMAKHSVWGYVFNVFATAVVVITGFIQHVWLNASISLIIMLPNIIYGLFCWIKNEKNNNKDANLKTMKSKFVVMWCLIAVVISALFTVVLWRLKGNMFFIDAPFTILCVVGVILNSRMYLENYYFFIPANFLGMIMYGILTIQNINNLPYIITYVIYTIVSILGLINWKKLNRKKQIAC